MFLINWYYSLLCIAICAGIWFYIGQTAPGLNQGIAGEFSMVNYCRSVLARVTGLVQVYISLTSLYLHL